MFIDKIRMNISTNKNKPERKKLQVSQTKTLQTNFNLYNPHLFGRCEYM